MSRKGLNIYKRKDGRWEARYIKSRTAQGKPLYGYLYASSYHEARNRLQDVIRLQGNAPNSKEMSKGSVFEFFSIEWLDTFSTSFKESTYIRYRTLIRCYLMPYFQTAKIESITKEHVLDFCKEIETHGKRDGTALSTKTVSDILSVLRRILHYAKAQNIPVDSAIFDMTMEKLLEYGSITPEVAQFLQKLVKARYNIFIAGGTGSGKTTFLNALSSYIPHDERIITIEDSAELQITQIPNIVRLETRNATASSGESKKIDIQSLIRSSLRMRPDRIIVGEVRGAEALDMLQAMNTGHDGSLSTGHANSAEDMLSRLETMVLQGEAALPLKAIRQQISSAVDIMIHLSRLRDHSRKTMMVSEILPHLDEKGDIRLNPLFEFREDENSTLQHVSGALVRTENPMIQTDKWTRAGFLLEDIPTAK